MIACMLSCRSVNNEGYVERHHYSRDADTLAAISSTERTDSMGYYRWRVDSLSRELYRINQAYHKLHVRDSINEVISMKDSVSVKDTTWMQVNPDGSITYHHDREKETYIWQQLERYRQQIVKESQATIDSLVEKNECLRAMYDSISRYQSLIDSAMVYRSKADSLSNVLRQQERIEIIKKDITGKIMAALATAVILVIIFIGVIIYMKIFRL